MLADGLAAIAYLIAAWLLRRRLEKAERAQPVPVSRTFWPGWIALALHLAALDDIFQPQGLNLSLFNAITATTALLVLLLLLVSLAAPLEKLGLLVFPVAAVSLTLHALVPLQPQLIRDLSWTVQLHIATSILAFSLLAIAAVQAGFLALQDRALRRHDRPPGWFDALPPLETMERLLFQLIAVGFILLSIALLTGFFFVHDLFAQHLVHKTVLSIAAWLVFALLLAGRGLWGWRGATAIRYTLGGFLTLLLAYLGSKLALELLLGRSWH